MKEYKYVTLEYENHKATTSGTAGHRAIIDEQAKNGFRYAGFIPTLMGPSGKILSADLVFEKDT